MTSKEQTEVLLKELMLSDIANVAELCCAPDYGITIQQHSDPRACDLYIPIEWIDTYCTDCSIDLRDNDAKAIKKLLEDWKKENE